MNFLKRAFIAVSRRKGKSLIMFIIFAAIANMVLAGLAIQHATDSASVLARQKLGGQLTLRFNMQNAMQKARAAGGQQRVRIQQEPVSEEMVKMVASQKNIKDYNYIVNASGTADGFEPVVTEESQSAGSDNSMQGRGGFGFGGAGFGGGSFAMPDVTVTGVSSSGKADVFKNGEAKMVSGRAIKPEDAGKKATIIEKNLAEENDLKVGDKINIKATRTEAAVKYSIIGIYESIVDSSSTGQGSRNMSFTQPYNRIFADYKSVIPLKTVTTDSGTRPGGIDQAVFYVDDPKNIEKVITDIKAMEIDWDKYTLDANEAAYSQMMGPIENVASFSMMVVYIVSVAGAVILALILTLSIKERMYETGVLLSMGESKIKIVAQYMTEVLLIALIAFSLSAFTGQIIAQGVGDQLLQREVAVSQEQLSDNGFPGSGGQAGGLGRRQGGWFGGRSDQTRVEAIDSMDISITPVEVEKMIGAGLLIIITGTILPAASVMRFKPKTILTKAS